MLVHWIHLGCHGTEREVVCCMYSIWVSWKYPTEFRRLMYRHCAWICIILCYCSQKKIWVPNYVSGRLQQHTGLDYSALNLEMLHSWGTAYGWHPHLVISILSFKFHCRVRTNFETVCSNNTFFGTTRYLMYPNTVLIVVNLEHLGHSLWSQRWYERKQMGNYSSAKDSTTIFPGAKTPTITRESLALQVRNSYKIINSYVVVLYRCLYHFNNWRALVPQTFSVINKTRNFKSALYLIILWHVVQDVFAALTFSRSHPLCRENELLSFSVPPVKIV